MLTLWFLDAVLKVTCLVSGVFPEARGCALFTLIDSSARYVVVSGVTNRYLVGPLDGPGGKPLK